MRTTKQNISKGFILVARKIQESKIWEKPAWWWKVFSYLLMQVSFKDGENKRGEGFFQYKEIYKACHLNKERGIKYKTIDNVIRWMKKEAICTTRKTTRGLYISISNYDIYQNIGLYKNDNKNELKTTQERHRNDTITKECNNDNNDNNIYSNLQEPHKAIKEGDKAPNKKLAPISIKDKLDKIIDKMREKKKIKEDDKVLISALYKRYSRPAKKLLEIADDNIDNALKSIDWVEWWCKERNLDWTLETVIKHYVDAAVCNFKKVRRRVVYG